MRLPCGKCVLFQPHADGQLDIDISTHCPIHGHTSAGLGLVAAICAVMFALACCVAAMSAISELMVFVAAVISKTLSLTAWHACKGATPPSTKHTSSQTVVMDPTMLSAGPLRRVGQKQEAAAVLLQLDNESSKPENKHVKGPSASGLLSRWVFTEHCGMLFSVILWRYALRALTFNGWCTLHLQANTKTPVYNR